MNPSTLTTEQRAWALAALDLIFSGHVQDAVLWALLRSAFDRTLSHEPNVTTVTVAELTNTEEP